MAKRRRHSSIHGLPDNIQDQVNKLLTTPGITYQNVVDFIREQGYQVSHSSVGRYGKDFLSRLERIQVAKEQARAIITESGDRPATELAEASGQLAMQLIMEHLMEVDDLEGERISEILKALAQLQRSSAGIEKLKLDYKQRAKKVAEKVADTLGKEGLSEDTLREIKEKIYGIVG